jgi:ParB family transcriptional regulator, chromosome partitioning protein
MSAKHAEVIITQKSFIESGMEIFIPLNKSKKSPRNARKTPDSEAAIEAYAASIAAPATPRHQSASTGCR